MVLFKWFFFSKINGFEKPHERGLVRSVVLFTTILDSSEGNDRPMCKLSGRTGEFATYLGFQIGAIRPIWVDHTDFFQVVIKTHSFIETGNVIDQTHISANANSRGSNTEASRAMHFGI